MSIFDVLAGIGLAGGDVFTALGLLGSTFLLLWMLAGKHMKRVPETMWIWAWSGTTIGVLCFISMLITGMRADKVGFIFGWSPSVVGGLLAVSVAQLGLSVAVNISRRPRHRRQTTKLKS